MSERPKPTNFTEAIALGIEEGAKFNSSRRIRRNIVSDRIKEVRIKNNLTQDKFCEIIDINKITYSGYENNRAETPIEVLVRIADNFNTSMDYLTGRTDNPLGMLIGKKAEEVNKTELEDIKKQIDELQTKLKKFE